MGMRRAMTGVAVLAALSACTPSPGPPSSPPPTHPTARLSTPAATPTPTPADALPIDFPVSGGLLDGEAQRVTRALWEVAGRAPALKLDVTPDDVVLTVLLADQSTRAYRWRADRIEQADSDVQYFKQATFNPTGYPLADLRRIFDVAALMGANGPQPMLQVGEYRDGDIYLSVTTRPETQLIFFRPDGTAIRQLGTSSVSDITDGIEAVTADTTQIQALGFDSQRGYWADVPFPDGTVERRTRLHNLPLFSARRSERSDLVPFPAGIVSAAAITMAVARFRETPSEECAVEIDNRHRRVRPVIRYDCGGDIHWSDLEGRDMTAQFN